VVKIVVLLLSHNPPRLKVSGSESFFQVGKIHLLKDDELQFFFKDVEQTITVKPGGQPTA